MDRIGGPVILGVVNHEVDTRGSANFRKAFSGTMSSSRELMRCDREAYKAGIVDFFKRRHVS